MSCHCDAEGRAEGGSPQAQPIRLPTRNGPRASYANSPSSPYSKCSSSSMAATYCRMVSSPPDCPNSSWTVALTSGPGMAWSRGAGRLGWVVGRPGGGERGQLQCNAMNDAYRKVRDPRSRPCDDTPLHAGLGMQAMHCVPAGASTVMFAVRVCAPHLYVGPVLASQSSGSRQVRRLGHAGQPQTPQCRLGWQRWLDQRYRLGHVVVRVGR